MKDKAKADVHCQSTSVWPSAYRDDNNLLESIFTQRENRCNDWVSIPPISQMWTDNQSWPVCYAMSNKYMGREEKKRKERRNSAFFLPYVDVRVYELSKSLYKAMITFIFFPIYWINGREKKKHIKKRCNRDVAESWELLSRFYIQLKNYSFNWQGEKKDTYMNNIKTKKKRTCMLCIAITTT